MSSTIKIKRSSVSGSIPSISDLELGELAINTNDGKLFFKKDDGTTESIETISPYSNSNLETYLNGNINTDLIPLYSEQVNLGSPTRRFYELYLAGNTIDIGGATISSDGSGQILISAAGAVLPAGSKVGDSITQKSIATIGDNFEIGDGGTLNQTVRLYTVSSGLSNIAATFSFRSNPRSRVFKAFQLSDGTSIEDSEITQFFF